MTDVARMQSETDIADTVLLDGFIYTMEQDLPVVEAVAVRDGKIMALGTSSEIQKCRGKMTRVVDLERRMAMPGLIDGHCHPTKGAIANLFSCKFEFAATPAEQRLYGHPVLEAFAGLEGGVGLGRQLDSLTGGRIAARAG